MGTVMATRVMTGGLFAVALFAAPAFAQPAPQQPGGITVTQENGVTVYRGEATPRPTASVSAKPAVLVAGGDTLWLVDADTREITGCRIRNTADHGRRRLSCTTGRLR